MYAIIETGGKQYRVEKGDVIDVERVNADANGKVSFSEVLFLQTGSDAKIGKPHLSSHVVTGELLEEVKGPKVFSFKYKRRKSQSCKKGHRQKYSRVKITEIEEAK